MKTIWRWLLIKLLCEQGKHGRHNLKPIEFEQFGGHKCARCHTVIMLSHNDYRHYYPAAWDVARGVDVDPFEVQA